MFARKDIFAKPSIPQAGDASGVEDAKDCVARLFCGYYTTLILQIKKFFTKKGKGLSPKSTEIGFRPLCYKLFKPMIRKGHPSDDVPDVFGKTADHGANVSAHCQYGNKFPFARAVQI